MSEERIITLDSKIFVKDGKIVADTTCCAFASCMQKWVATCDSGAGTWTDPSMADWTVVSTSMADSGSWVYDTPQDAHYWKQKGSGTLCSSMLSCEVAGEPPAKPDSTCCPDRTCMQKWVASCDDSSCQWTEPSMAEWTVVSSSTVNPPIPGNWTYVGNSDAYYWKVNMMSGLCSDPSSCQSPGTPPPGPDRECPACSSRKCWQYWTDTCSNGTWQSPDFVSWECLRTEPQDANRWVYDGPGMAHYWQGVGGLTTTCADYCSTPVDPGSPGFPCTVCTEVCYGSTAVSNPHYDYRIDLYTAAAYNELGSRVWNGIVPIWSVPGLLSSYASAYVTRYAAATHSVQYNWNAAGYAVPQSCDYISGVDCESYYSSTLSSARCAFHTKALISLYNGGTTSAYSVYGSGIYVMSPYYNYQWAFVGADNLLTSVTADASHSVVGAVTGYALDSVVTCNAICSPAFSQIEFGSLSVVDLQSEDVGVKVYKHKRAAYANMKDIPVESLGAAAPGMAISCSPMDMVYFAMETQDNVASINSANLSRLLNLEDQERLSHACTQRIAKCPQWYFMYIAQWGLNCGDVPPREFPFGVGDPPQDITSECYSPMCTAKVLPEYASWPSAYAAVSPAYWYVDSTIWLHEADESVDSSGNPVQTPVLRAYDSTRDGHRYRILRMDVHNYPGWWKAGMCSGECNGYNPDIPKYSDNDIAWSVMKGYVNGAWPDMNLSGTVYPSVGAHLHDRGARYVQEYRAVAAIDHLPGGIGANSCSNSGSGKVDPMPLGTSDSEYYRHYTLSSAQMAGYSACPNWTACGMLYPYSVVTRRATAVSGGSSSTWNDTSLYTVYNGYAWTECRELTWQGHQWEGTGTQSRISGLSRAMSKPASGSDSYMSSAASEACAGGMIAYPASECREDGSMPRASAVAGAFLLMSSLGYSADMCDPWIYGSIPEGGSVVVSYRNVQSRHYTMKVDAMSSSRNTMVANRYYSGGKLGYSAYNYEHEIAGATTYVGPTGFIGLGIAVSRSFSDWSWITSNGCVDSTAVSTSNNKSIVPNGGYRYFASGMNSMSGTVSAAVTPSVAALEDISRHIDRNGSPCLDGAGCWDRYIYPVSPVKTSPVHSEYVTYDSNLTPTTVYVSDTTGSVYPGGVGIIPSNCYTCNVDLLKSPAYGSFDDEYRSWWYDSYQVDIQSGIYSMHVCCSQDCLINYSTTATWSATYDDGYYTMVEFKTAVSSGNHKVDVTVEYFPPSS